MEAKSRFFLILACLFAASTTLVVVSFQKTASVLADDCGPNDISYVTQRLECGGRAWELVASDRADDEWDEGEWSQTAMCGGAYTDCNCNYVPPYVWEATKIINYDQTGDPGYWSFWWNLYGYNPPTNQTCTSGSCKGTGQTQTNNPISLDMVGYDTEYQSCAP
jgi:hypothetical protein